MKKVALVLMAAFLAMTTVQAQEKPVDKKEAKTAAAKCDHKKGEGCSKCEKKGNGAKKECCSAEKKAEKNCCPTEKKEEQK